MTKSVTHIRSGEHSGVGRAAVPNCRKCGTGMHARIPGDTCRRCHYGRGLCQNCYARERDAGRLAQWPRVTGKRPVRDCQHKTVKHEHGTPQAYTADGCGCERCCAAEAAYKADRAKRRYLARGGLLVSPVGTVRRVRALMALGWTGKEIAQRAGLNPSHLANMHTRTTVLRSTADRIRVIYDELSMRHGPSACTRSYARNRGYAPPLAWDDETIDDPAVSPHVGREDRSPAARRLARIDEYHDLRAMGVSDAEIAANYWGISDEGMERWLYRNIRTTEERAA